MKPPRSRRGNTLIEFAVSLLLITTSFTGAFQYGYSFYSYNRLVNAVREGARYASLQSPNSLQSNPDVPKAIRNLVIYGDPHPMPGAAPVLAGLSERHVELAAGAKTVTVAISDFPLDGLFGKVRLDGRPSITFPYTIR